MRSIIKKIVIYPMIGIMQIGLFSSVVAASPGPLHNDNPPRMAQYDDRDDHDRDHDRQHEHDERLRQENERHEREMRRHHHESKQEWRKRQRRENERHERELRIIEALLVGIAIGSSNSK